MHDHLKLINDVRAMREQLGWSQADLARHAGLSRTGISAIESHTLIPSTAAALALASALGCRVEDLFRPGDPHDSPAHVAWAWLPHRWPARFWAATHDSRTLLFPTEHSPLGLVPHDGVAQSPHAPLTTNHDAQRTLVLASCDPAVSLLAEALERENVRLRVLQRSSRDALRLLGQKLVHLAGIHLAGPTDNEPPAALVRDLAGPGFRLIRGATWQAGLFACPTLRLRNLRAATAAPRLRWIGREEGSGARQCLDALRPGRPAPRRLAADHHGVAQAIRLGWADVGVGHQLAAEQAGLDFLPIRSEHYELVFPSSQRADPRIHALRKILRSNSFRQRLADLPGYAIDTTGAELSID
jgi:molybdate-binding protein/DNA-binding XRE family transcriptional regulator